MSSFLEISSLHNKYLHHYVTSAVVIKKNGYAVVFAREITSGKRCGFDGIQIPPTQEAILKGKNLLSLVANTFLK